MSEPIVLKIDTTVYPRQRVTCSGCGETTLTRWIPWCRSACWLCCAVCGLVSRATPRPL